MKLTDLIFDFLNRFCTVAGEEEDEAITELMMDDHTCIEYNGIQYYVPENNSLFSDEDELMKSLLNASFGL